MSLVAVVPGCLDPLIEDPGATGPADGAPNLPATPLPGQTAAPGTPAIPVVPGTTTPVTPGVAPTPVTPPTGVITPGTPPASTSSDVASEDIPGVVGDAGATFEADSGTDTVEPETSLSSEPDAGADTGVVP